jgi:hypothetical protein
MISGTRGKGFLQGAEHRIQNTEFRTPEPPELRTPNSELQTPVYPPSPSVDAVASLDNNAASTWEAD